MASYETGRPLGGPLPKFGEWDVNDPASAEGFTVIFNKARDDKKSGGTPMIVAAPQNYGTRQESHKNKYLKKRKWFCCGCN